MSKLIAVSVLVSLMGILVTHADQVNLSSYTPFLDAVKEHTTCAASTDGCVQTVRQIRSLIAALAAAVCTIATAITTSKRRQVAYCVLAGTAGLKAVFNQMMYITGGDLMLPIIIMIVAVLCAAAMGGGFVFVDDGDKGSADASES